MFGLVGSTTILETRAPVSTPVPRTCQVRPSSIDLRTPTPLRDANEMSSTPVEAYTVPLLATTTELAATFTRVPSAFLTLSVRERQLAPPSVVRQTPPLPALMNIVL